MTSFPLIPRTEDEFKKIIYGVYNILNSALYRDNNTREWCNPDLCVFSHVFKNFAENRGIFQDEQKGLLAENELKKIRSLLQPTYKVYDYIIKLSTLVGIDDIIPDQKDYNFILKQPEFDFLRERNLLKKNVNQYMIDTLTQYFTMLYLYRNYDTFIPDKTSEEFYNEFIHYYDDLKFTENTPEEIKKLQKYPDESKLVIFYSDLYKKALKFYGYWWTTRNTDLEQIIFLNHLKNNSDEKPYYGTPVRINNGLVVDYKYLYSQKSYKRKNIAKDFYIIYILCEETGTVYNAVYSFFRNITTNTPVIPTKKVKKKSNRFSRENFHQISLGMRLNITGKLSHKAMVPLNLIKNRKVFKFTPFKITHARFSLPKSQEMKSLQQNSPGYRE